MGRKRTISLTVLNRILLHLDRFSRYKTEYVVPLDVTQEGISNHLKVRQNHVSRALKKLRDQGLAYHRSAHVAGIERRRRVYFTTTRGQASVKRQWERIRNQQVTLKTRTGEIREVMFRELRGAMTSQSTDNELLWEILEWGGIKDGRDLRDGTEDAGVGDRGKGNLGKGNLGKGNLGKGNLGKGNLGKGNLGKGDLGKGDLGKGDLGKGDLGKGDLGKGDLGKGNLGKGNLGKGNLGKGDLGKGNLGKGDMDRAAMGDHIPAAEGAVTTDADDTAGTVPTESTSPIPPLETFYGRDDEVKRITESLGKDTVRSVVVTGIAGIGKTTLMVRSVQGMADKYDIVWYNMKKWEEPDDLLGELGEYLASKGLSGLKKELRKSGPVPSSAAFKVLKQSLRGVRLILVVDDLQKASREMLKLLGSIFEMISSRGMEGVKLLVISRKVPSFYSRKHVNVSKSVVELAVEGLDRESSRGIVGHLDDRSFDRLYDMTGGHPLYLSLLRSSDPLSAAVEFGTFMEDEIFARLSDDQLRLIKLASIYRYPVPSDGLFQESGMDARELVELARRGLVIERPPGYFSTHEFVRGFVDRLVTPLEQKRLHTLASKYYSQGTDEFSFVEEVYHLLASDNPKDAARRCVESVPVLIDRGYLNLLPLLEPFEDIELDPVLSTGITELRARLFAARGQTGRARYEYEKMLKHTARGKKGGDRTSAMGRLGDLSAQEDRWDRMYNLNRQALDLARKRKDNKSQGKLLNNMGYALLRQGRYQEAKKRYDQALRILQGRGDREAYILTLINLGNAWEAEGHISKARGSYNRAVSMSREAGFSLGMAEARLRLGKVKRAQGDLNGALSELQEASRSFEHLEDIRGAVKVAIEQGDLLFESGRITQSRGQYSRALDLLKDLQSQSQILSERIFSIKGSLTPSTDGREIDRDSLDNIDDTHDLESQFDVIKGRLLRRLGDCLISEGDHRGGMRFYHQALNELSGDWARSERVRALMALGREMFGDGKTEDAIDKWQEALDMLVGMDDLEGQVVAHLNMANAHISSRSENKRQMAKNHLSMARGLAKKTKDRDLMGMVKDARLRLDGLKRTGN